MPGFQPDQLQEQRRSAGGFLGGLAILEGGDLSREGLAAGPGGLRSGLGDALALAEPHAAQGGREPVVVRLPDRVELVVVAPGAMDRQAQVRLRRGADDPLQLLLAGRGSHGGGPLVLHRLVVRSDHELPGGHDRRGVVGLEDIAGQLEANEPVVGHVGIERLDDPVAIPPGVGPEPVVLEALGLGEADDVEPVPRPALAVSGARPGSGPPAARRRRVRVGDERLDLLGRRRQAEQVEGEAADQRAAVGLGRRRQVARRQPRQDEGIDRPDRRAGAVTVGGSGRVIGCNDHQS